MLGFRLPTAAAIATKRPSCPKCETMMMLARIVPYSSGYRKRTFECPSCDFIETRFVPDPLRSEEVNCLADIVGPPE